MRTKETNVRSKTNRVNDIYSPKTFRLTSKKKKKKKKKCSTSKKEDTKIILYVWAYAL